MRRLLSLLIVPFLVALIAVVIGMPVASAQQVEATTTTEEQTVDTVIVQPPVDGLPIDPDSPTLEVPVITREEIEAASSKGEAASLEVRARIDSIARDRIVIADAERDSERETLVDVNDQYLRGLSSAQSSGRYLDQIQFSYRELVDDLIAARRSYATTLLLGYIIDIESDLQGDLEGKTVLESTGREIYMKFVLDAQAERLKQSSARLEDVNPDIIRVADELGEARADLEDLLDVRKLAERLFAEANLRVTDANDLAYEWQFPVFGTEYNFIDSFLAPRYVANKYDHPHQGADIMAPYGTPIVAVERGMLFKVGVGTLGGNKLWVLGESGTAYYYAHLAGFAEITANGVLVEPGQVIGFVGDTGNARGTPPHLHFEIHPDAGRAVNPTSLLRFAQDRDQTP